MDVSLRLRIAAYAGMLLCSIASTAHPDEVRITSRNYTLNGDITIAEGRQISDPIVLIVHGTLGHKDMDLIATLQEAFQEAGQNSLAINLSLNIDDRAGFYPCDVLHSHKPSDALVEIEAWLDWLAEQGTHDVTLLGHSRGANQVARYVAETKRKVQGSVLLAPPINASSAASAVLQGTASGLADEVLEGIDFLYCENTDVMSSTYLEYGESGSKGDLIQLIQKTNVPTLVISGSDDAIAPGVESRMQEIDSSFVTHHEISGAGHFFRDLYAYDVVDLVTGHMDRQRKPGLVTLASSLRDDSEISRSTGRPVVVFISQQSCEYCALLRKRILLPMIRAGSFEGRVVFREITLDPGFDLLDFDGAVIAGKEFAERYRVYVTPTLLFLDARGKSVAEPLVGTSNIDLYEFYLNRAIDAAGNKLAQ